MKKRKMTAGALREFARGVLWIADQIEGEEMTVEVLKRDVNGKPTKAMLVSDGGARIVAQKLGFADWEALYALDADGGELDLPSCFSLNNEAIEALELAAT